MKFIIIGLGQFGRALALKLAEDGREVIVIDSSEEITSELKDKVSLAMIADAKDPRFLSQLDLTGEVTVFVTIGENFEASMLVTAQLQELGVKHIYCRAISKTHIRILRLMGVEGIIQPENMAATQLAMKFDNESFLRRVAIDATHALAEIRLPDAWAGQTLAEVRLRARYRLNLLTIRRGLPNAEDVNGDNIMNMGLDPLETPATPVIDFPEPGMIFEKGDLLILFGTEKDLSTFAEEFEV